MGMQIKLKRQHLLYVSIFGVWADVLTTGVRKTIAEGKATTGDLGGKASTQEYTAAIVGKL
jgi:isocitrate/isopropylmalate dehydrogenase